MKSYKNGGITQICFEYGSYVIFNGQRLLDCNYNRIFLRLVKYKNSEVKV